MAMTDFVVVGFPKCGTSALMRLLQKLPGLVVDRDGDSLEAPFYITPEAAQAYEAARAAHPADGRIHGHKYVSYIFSPSALERIARHNPTAVFVVCVRDPFKALVSWRNMHRQIAGRDSDPGHFIHQDGELRRFYAEASLAEYYRQFARPRLRYAELIRRLIATAAGHRVVVVEQAALASDPDLVLSVLAEEFGLSAGAAAATGVSPARRAHVGVGDLDKGEPLDPEMHAEVEGERWALGALLDELEAKLTARVVRPRSALERAAIRERVPRSVAVLGSSNGIHHEGYRAAVRAHPLVAEIKGLSMAASPAPYLNMALQDVQPGSHELYLFETMASDAAAIRAGAFSVPGMVDALEAAVERARALGGEVAALLLPTRRCDGPGEQALAAQRDLYERLAVPHLDASPLLRRLATTHGRPWDSLFRDAAQLHPPLARALVECFLADLFLPGRPGPVHASEAGRRYRFLSRPAGAEALKAPQQWVLACEPGETLEAVLLDRRASSAGLRVRGARSVQKDLRFQLEPGQPRLTMVTFKHPVAEAGGSLTLAVEADVDADAEPSYLADRTSVSAGVVALAGCLLAGPSRAAAPPPRQRLAAWQPGESQFQLLARALATPQPQATT